MGSSTPIRVGIRAGIPLVVPVCSALAVPFGVLARSVIGSVAPIVMSVAVFANEVEIECGDGDRRCFKRGATLALSPLSIRTIRNPSTQLTRLLAINRRAR